MVSWLIRLWCGNLKHYAAIIVLLAGGFEIKIGKGDSARMPGRQIKKSHADDGVVFEFQLATIFEDEQSRFLRRVGIGCGGVIILSDCARHGSISHLPDIRPSTRPPPAQQPR